MNVLDTINPPITVRAWIYRVLFLTALIVVGAALIFGQDPATIIATATTVTTIVTGALAIINTSTSKPDDGDAL